MTKRKILSPNDAYLKAEEFAKSHYENFPVVSLFIKKEMRKHVAIIYWFARTADDIADEDNFTVEERLLKINNFNERLTHIVAGDYTDEYEHALYLTINERKLTPVHFFNLLKAFKQDIFQQKWNTFNDILDYCTNSANPVGRLILELYNVRDDKAFYYSDKICTALQLTNFYQDVSKDILKNRIYFPIDEIEKFGVKLKSFELNENNDNLRRLVKFNVERAESFFREGENLLNYLSGRLQYEIKWTILGGRAILKKIIKSDYNVINIRPSLSKFDYFFLFLKSLMP
ncbi:MAG: squalene synthase HpnC [Ignavibacteria bacterium CG_4_9_14_3_um_filter_36_18]|nr:MAG: squalene synthase HpnC [Ignavibacteria bacterium CG_4_9_14_3_um_filter_36_18]